MNLPNTFEEKMKHLLGEEYEDYLKCYEEPRHYGLRVNTNKISVEDFLKSLHGRCVRFHGSQMDFIMTEIRSSRQSIRTILQDCIICRSQAR